MTLKIVQDRLDKLLATDMPRVAMLTGDWGSGKTYQWKQALERHAKKGPNLRHAYVSLFGLTSLAEVRKRITEEIISAIRLPGRSDTLGEAVDGGAIGLKPMQILKILPVIPYLGKLDSLAQELSFATVRNVVICFDDLERAPTSLRIADVFGLASFLKEERGCRILLISNQKKFSDDIKNEFSTYLEKVVEETVDFAPTPTEACIVALGSEPSEAGKILRDNIIRLGVSNIRVINRLGILAEDLAKIAKGLHAKVLLDLIHTLAIFGVAHFIPQKNFPTTEYLLQYGSANWSKFFNKKKEGEETEQQKQEADWDRLISRYGYKETTALDKQVYAGIISGFFRNDTITIIAEDFSRLIDDGDKKKAFDEKIHHFWWGAGDSKIALDQLLSSTNAAIKLINLSELHGIYQILRDLQKKDASQELLNQYIAANQSRPEALELSDHLSSTCDPVFKAAFEANAVRPPTPIDLAKTLDSIDFRRGWNRKDLIKIAEAKFDDILLLLTDAKEDRLFASRLATLLKFGEHGESAAQKRVQELTITWLEALAATDPISALRVRRFLPADPGTSTPDNSFSS